MGRLLYAVVMLMLPALCVFARAPQYQIEAQKSKHEVLRAQLEARGYIESPSWKSIGFKFKWSYRYVKMNSDLQIHNHFRNFDALDNKCRLHKWLSYRGADFVPETFILGDKKGKQGEPEHDLVPGAGEEDIWIVKPCSGTRGVGITLLAGADWATFDVGDQPSVAQKYIENPLVVLNRKFDIRLFVLVTSLDPLQAFINTDCYLRFTGEDYKLDKSTLDRQFMHLTNHQVQKNAPASDSNAPFGGADLQWSLERFKEHLGDGSWDAEIFPRLEALVRDTLRAWPARKFNHRDNSFELLGFDILLDEEKRPWLLEVNSNPGLHLLTEVTIAHHTKAVTSLVEIVVDGRKEEAMVGSFKKLF